MSNLNLYLKSRGVSWKSVKGSTMVTAGMAGGRALGMAFSLVLAAIFSPRDFGALQYAITLATIAAVITQPFGQKMIARFIAIHREQAGELRVTLNSVWALQMIFTGLTLLVAVPALLWMHQPLAPGVLVTLIGFTLFYSYWGLARGFHAPGRLVAAYLGSNAFQLLLILFLTQALAIRSPLVALLVYGSAYFVPLALLMRFWPLTPVPLDLRAARPERMREILQQTWPVWISQAGYMLFSTLDILLLEHFHGEAAVGVYRLAKTLAVVFLFITEGNNILLLPAVASAPRSEHRKLVLRSLGIATALNLAMLGPYLLLERPFVRIAFGAEYLMETRTVLALVGGTIVMGFHFILTAFFVGTGRAGVESISWLAALAVTSLTGFLLVPAYAAFGAALAVLAGSEAALFTYLLSAARSGKNTALARASFTDQADAEASADTEQTL